MTDLRKAAEMALDALRLYVTMYPQMDKGYMVDARETLRQALAQPEPPFKLSDAGADTNITRGLEPKGKGMVTLHQREWVGLTDDEIKKIVDLNTSDDGGFDIWCDGIAVAHIVCAKLKKKNA